MGCALPQDPKKGRAEAMLGGCRGAAGDLPARVPTPLDCAGAGGAVTWTAELDLVWIVDGRRVPGRVAIGVPEFVPDGDGEAICQVALDGLQPVTRVHGDGAFHTLMQAVRFLHQRLRHYVTDGVRVVFPADDIEDPERGTASLLEMFKPFD
jgi:hypothetical protein